MPVLRARVGGQWVDIVNTVDEVWIGPDDPLGADPTGTWELWYDTAAAVLNVLIAGVWTPAVATITPPSEVAINVDDPYVVDPLALDELWVDSDALPKPVLYGRIADAWAPLTSEAPDEVWVSIDEPTDPSVELWYDPDDATSVQPPSYPTGGTFEQALVKLSDVTNDVGWGGPHLKLAEGGTVTGPLVVEGNHLSIPTDGLGVALAGGALLYRRVGGAVVVREGSDGAQPQIEDNGGANGRDIIDTVNGDARYALKADVTAITPGAWQNCTTNFGLGSSVAQYRDTGGAICVKFNVETGQGASSLGHPVFTIPGPKPYTDIRFWGRDVYAGNTWVEFVCLTNGQVQLMSLSGTRHTAGTFMYPKP